VKPPFQIGELKRPRDAGMLADSRCARMLPGAAPKNTENGNTAHAPERTLL
jgi:hypothetical protein